ncbi:MAG: Flp pilus assembly complex ATPase component [Acidobacteria bacterium]|nr:Flp pilus assembly complex ATPase component [Acidobacteriota bacterium]
MKLTIVGKDGTRKELKSIPAEFVVGREAPAQVVLPSTIISRRHAVFQIQDGRVWVTDTSSNGVFIDKVRLEKNKQTPVQPGKPVIIGEYALVFEADQGMKKQSAVIEADKPVVEKASESTTEFSEEQLNALSGIRDQIHKRLLETLDLRWVDFTAKRDQELSDLVSKRLDMILSQMSAAIPKWVDRKALKKEMQDEVVGLGPLEDFLRDEDVSEIMVISKDLIYVEKKGKLVESKKRFSSDPALMAIIERIVAPIGKRIDESSPLVDARLKDGSRVNAIIPPLALKGPCLTIRKFGTKRLGIDDMIGFGTLSPAMAKFLEVCVKGKKNIIISGGTGSGKTTLLNVIASFIQHDDRIITIEDAAELRLPQRHVVTLESKPANVEGKGAITIRDLVKNALRMRPDRIIVGECRGGEALDMLQAMNTGHAGSMTTGHANSPEDILRRLETMVLMSGMDLPIRAIRDQIGSAIDIIVQQSRLSDGSRKIMKISEVLGLDDEYNVLLEDVFTFEQKGVDAKGKVVGKHMATGYLPSFLADFKARGIEVPEDLFKV